MSQQNVEFHDRHIAMAHGAGGEATRRLVEGLFRPLLGNPFLNKLSDAAVLPSPSGEIAITTDCFVVQPLSFPGGSIGDLAINGIVNDLAVAGARPFAITVGLILEAGLDSEILRREIRALAQAAARVGVSIVAGDTKVVEHGKADGMYITATGLGMVDRRAKLGPQYVQIGDRVLLSGPIGNHGMAILLARAELEIDADIRSDTRPLTRLVDSLLQSTEGGIRWMRDATRGGVATVLNELARDANVTITVEEEAVPLDDAVRGACELLGLDPLHVANEGQFVAIVAADMADAALAALKRTPGGERACLLGEIGRDRISRVIGKAAYGGTRVIDMLIGDPLPRIC